DLEPKVMSGATRDPRPDGDGPIGLADIEPHVDHWARVVRDLGYFTCEHVEDRETLRLLQGQCDIPRADAGPHRRAQRQARMRHAQPAAGEGKLGEAEDEIVAGDARANDRAGLEAPGEGTQIEAAGKVLDR